MPRLLKLPASHFRKHASIWQNLLLKARLWLTTRRGSRMGRKLKGYVADYLDSLRQQHRVENRRPHEIILIFQISQRVASILAALRWLPSWVLKQIFGCCCDFL